MAGLLDFEMPGLDTPQGQGLLSAAFSLMQAKKMPGQKGAFAGALGEAGQQYLQSSNASQDQMMKRKYLDAQMQAQQMQLEQARQAQAEKQLQEAAIRAAFAPRSPTSALQGGGGPTNANAALIGSMPQFNPLQLLNNGGVGALEQGLKINSALNPAPKFETVAAGSSMFKMGPNGPELAMTAPSAPKEKTLPSAVQEYEYAKGQGYGGTFEQWDTARKRAGATSVNVGGAKNIFQQEGEQSKAYGKGMGDLRIEIQKSAFNAPGQIAKLSRLEELLQGVEGGKLAPLGTEVAGLAKSLGFNIDPKLGNKQAAEALAVEMALSMKPVGSGAMSDRDFENFMQTVPSLSKTAEGRKQITQTLKAKAQRDLEIGKMARSYAAKNNGVIDDGFLDQAAGYSAQNPIFSGGASSGANVDALVNKYRSK